MAEYGAPKRDAVQDANAGIVNTPTVRTRNRVQAVKQKQITSLDTGVASFGEAFGRAAEGLVDDAVKNIREKRALDAAIRQGTDKAVNRIDQNNKRTGAAEWIFGQDAGYEEAQRMAVENNVQAMYLEQATVIDDYAGETPEEYSVRLSSTLDAMLDKHPNDQKTRDSITLAWMKAGGKLAGKQMEAHYGWTQVQNRQRFADRTRQNFDTLFLDSRIATSPEEYTQVLEDAAKQFDGSDIPTNMTPNAWKSVKNEELNNSLREGNIGPFFAAKAAGWNDNLGPAERVAQDKAISAYDTDFDQQASVFIEDAKLGEAIVNSVDEAAAYWNTLDDRIDQLERRSTGTERAELTLAKARRMAAEARKNLAKAGLKASAKADRQTRLQGILRKSPTAQTAEFSAERQSEDGAFKKVEIDAALDANVIEDVKRLTGKEELTNKAAIVEMLNSPQVSLRVAQVSKESTYTAPIIKEMANTLINGWSRMVDDQGRPTEELNSYVASVAQFAQDDNKFKSAVGDDNYKKWLLLQRGIGNGNSAEKIQKESDKFFENKGKVDKWKTRWPLAEDQTHQQYVASLVTGFGGGYPSGGAMSYYMEEFQDGLQIYDGDFTAAKNYLQTTVKNGTVRSGRAVIPNGKHLDNISEDYRFDELITGMESANVNWMKDVMGQMMGDTRDRDGNPMTRLEQLDDYEIYTIDGIDGVYINSQSADRPVRIPASELRKVGDKLNKAREFEERRIEAEAAKTANQWSAAAESKKALSTALGTEGL